MKKKQTLPWLAAAALALTLPFAAVAADETPATPETPEATAPVGDGDAIAGLKVGKDPKSGQLRKITEAEEAELTRQAREFWAQFPRHSAKKDRRSGLTSLVVAPHSISFSVAAVGQDGQAEWDCVEDVDHVSAKIAELSQRPANAAVTEDR